MKGDSKRTLAPRSAKLPKLTMQEQINNQQVARRINSKIAFTRNPRHLPQTITLSDAFAKDTPQTKFTAQPSQIFFSDYDQHHIYEAELKLVNHSQHTQRIKVAPLTQKEFVVAKVRYPRQDCGDIAPGLAVVVSIRFRPPSLNNYNDQLVIIAGDGTLRVPIIAERQRSLISWPKIVDCGHCWVGDVIKKEIILNNKGGEATFNLVQSKSQFFKVGPSTVAFMKHGKLALNFSFTPQREGAFKQKITFKPQGDNQQAVVIELQGGAYSAKIALEELARQKIVYQKKNYTLWLQGAELGLALNSQMKIKNLAVVQVDYFWHWKNTKLTLSPSKGKVKPSQLMQFGLSLTPQSTAPQTHRLSLYLFGLPQKSLGENVSSLKIDGIDAIECLSIDVVTVPKSSQVSVSPLHTQIVQPIYQNCPVTEKVRIFNNSQASRRFQIKLINQDQGVQCSANISQGMVQAKNSIQIQLIFCLTQLTKLRKNACLSVSFDSGQAQLISLSGTSTYPQLQLSTQRLYYGLCKTFCTKKQTLTVSNLQSSAVQFKLHNNNRFYQFDFYDFYQFEDESSYQPRFIVKNPETELELTDWYEIQPNSEIQLQCFLSCRQEQSINLQLLLEIKNGQTRTIQIVAQCQDVQLQLSEQHLDLKQLQRGSVYNLRSLINKDLRLLNQGNHDCAFQISSFQLQNCKINFQPSQGIIKQHSQQHIDVIIQPLVVGHLDIPINWKFYDDFKVNPQLQTELRYSLIFNIQQAKSSTIKQRTLRISGIVKEVSQPVTIKPKQTSQQFQNTLFREHQPKKKITVDTIIPGPPIIFSRNQLGINFNSEVPLMKLGTVLPRNGLLKRTIKVVNNGLKAMALKWKIYPYNETKSDQDLFSIEIGQPSPDSGDQVKLNWNAIKPEVAKVSHFTLQPLQKTLKARQEATFSVIIKQIASQGIFSNLLVCEPEQVQTGKTLESLALVVQADAVGPHLTQDSQHGNQPTQLQRFAISPEQPQTNSNNFIRKLKMKNTVSTNLTFDLYVSTKDEKQDSFSIVKTNTNSPITQLTKTNVPLTNFNLSTNSVVEISVQLKGNPNNLDQWPMQEKTRKQGQLSIKFSNKDQQIVDLVGYLYRPWMQIVMPDHTAYSSENFLIDFGTVHVKNSKKLSVHLINPSKVDAKWTASFLKYHQSIKYKFQESLWTHQDHQDQHIIDQKKCWKLNSQGGIVRSMTLPVHYMPITSALYNKDDRYASTHRPTELTFLFKPESNVLYKSKFRLTVAQGLSFDIVVRGKGTFQEQLQIK